MKGQDRHGQQREYLRNDIAHRVETEIFHWATLPIDTLTLERDGVQLISFAERSAAFSRFLDHGLSNELLRHIDGVLHFPEDAASNPGAIIFRSGAGFPEDIDPRLRVFLNRRQIDELAAALDAHASSLSDERQISQRSAHPNWFWDIQL